MFFEVENKNSVRHKNSSVLCSFFAAKVQARLNLPNVNGP